MNMNFEPFIGDFYEEQNPKILVIGESHHFNNSDYKDFLLNPQSYKKITSNVINNYLKYKKNKLKFENWMNTFTRFSNIFSNKKLSNKEQIDFWNKLAFYNYVQTPVDATRKSPTAEQFYSSHNFLFDVLDGLKPNLIIIWGYRLWNKIPKEKAFIKNDVLEFYLNIPILVIPHPASSKLKYSQSDWISNYVKNIVKHYS